MSPCRPARLGPAVDAPFPPAENACIEPNGLLALGGGLEPERLLRAYAQGIFPWYEAGSPILWWSPDPRAVFFTNRMHLPRRLARRMRQLDWIVRADYVFDEVIEACAQVPRAGQSGTWITPAMRAAYRALHARGHAHSIEVCDGEGRLLGGLYGVAVGRLFCGESMFSRAPSASSLALLALSRRLEAWGWPLIDAQILNPHTARFGAVELARVDFLARARALVAQPEPAGDWQRRFGQFEATELATPAG